MSNINDLRSSAAWQTYEKKSKSKIMEKYHNRFVVILSESKKSLYLSGMILSKLIRPDFIELKIHGTQIGMCIGTKATGFKVEYKTGVTPSISVTKFVKDFELKHAFAPGAYECIVEAMDAQTTDHYDLVIFNTSDHPAK